MAPVRLASSTPLERVYELVTIHDEPVVLRARRDRDFPGLVPAEAPPQPLELCARVGRTGDPARERLLLDAVARRLGQLAGVDYAPIRW